MKVRVQSKNVSMDITTKRLKVDMEQYVQNLSLCQKHVGHSVMCSFRPCSDIISGSWKNLGPLKLSLCLKMGTPQEQSLVALTCR